MHRHGVRRRVDTAAGLRAALFLWILFVSLVILSLSPVQGLAADNTPWHRIRTGNSGAAAPAPAPVPPASSGGCVDDDNDTTDSAVSPLAAVAWSDGTRVSAITPPSRRNVLMMGVSSASAAAVAFLAPPPQAANARVILNQDSGEFEEVVEGNWQGAWKDRLDKAQSMSQEEVFRAARGAGNVNLKEGPESDASKKRRAMAGCREADLRAKAHVDSAKECTTRVLQGDTSFMLDVMQ